MVIRVVNYIKIMTTLQDNPETVNAAQKRFDETYITGHQIMEMMGISRPTLLYARRTKKLPEPINVQDGHLYIWERAVVEPYLLAWKTILIARRQG